MTNAATASRPIDPTTATAIRQAMQAAQMGRIGEACLTAERALASGGEPVALNAMLGMLRMQSGDPRAAVRHLELAHEGRPKDVRIATNLATALVQLEDMERAFQVASPELAFADPTLQLARIRGFVADQLSDFDAAVAALEHVVGKAPEDCESWNNLGNARRGVGDWQRSADALRRAVDLDTHSAPIRLNYAKALLEAGRHEEAEAAFRQMAVDFPEDPKPLRELHVMLKNMLRDEESLEAIDAAVARDPTNLELLLAEASHLSSMHRMEACEATYRRVIDLDRANATAHLGLALTYELSNRIDDLARLVRQAEERGVGEGAVQFVRAYHFNRTKRFEEGLAALEQVPEEMETPRRAHLMAQLLDGAGRYDEAFAEFAHMNDLFREDPSMPEERAANYRTHMAEAPSLITEEVARSWREETEPDSRRPPVFLVGFPRSGTTLLDTILMSHPKIEVLEEEPAMKKALEVFGADVAALPNASDEQIKAARDAYFEMAASVTPLAPGNLLIDKNPLTMNLLPFVRRIFPRAKILLALRHPCDVILSCFMANFRLNAGMANFIRLDTAAELYDLSFSYFEHVQRLMPMPAHTVVYENVVADRERELRELLDFLELAWEDSVLDHQTTALKRGRIKTASYAQVAEPIYTRSAGRWQKYRKHLEPIFPVLDPWVKKFGYSLDES